MSVEYRPRLLSRPRWNQLFCRLFWFSSVIHARLKATAVAHVERTFEPFGK